jgi:hypothetical protein
MRLSRLLALILAAATALFVLAMWLKGELGMLQLGLLTTAILLIALPGLRRSRTPASRWILVLASSGYTLIALACLALQFNEQASLLVRGGLSTLVMLGAALSLRCAYQLNRPKRYGFHNYYDQPG